MESIGLERAMVRGAYNNAKYSGKADLSYLVELNVL